MFVKYRETLTTNFSSLFLTERWWVRSTTGKGVGLGDLRPDAQLQCGSTPIGNDLCMDHSTMMIYRFIWQCDAGHIDIIWDIVISLFDPVLDSMPCSFFKRYIQSTALQARGRVCRVRVHSTGCSSSGYSTRIHDAVCSQGSVFFKICKDST